MIEYTRTITDEEQKILEHDLLDIKDWIDQAIIGKINNCKKRIQKVIVAEEDIGELSKIDTDLIQAFLKKPGYKNRTQREQI